MSGVKISESGQKLSRNGPDSPRSGCGGDEAALRARLAGFLRRAAPVKTAEVIGAEVSVPAATARNWLNEEAFPNGFALIRLYRRYGLAFLVEVLGETPERARALLERAERRTALVAQLDALDRMPV